MFSPGACVPALLSSLAATPAPASASASAPAATAAGAANIVFAHSSPLFTAAPFLMPCRFLLFSPAACVPALLASLAAAPAPASASAPAATAAGATGVAGAAGPAGTAGATATAGATGAAGAAGAADAVAGGRSQVAEVVFTGLLSSLSCSAVAEGADGQRRPDVGQVRCKVEGWGVCEGGRQTGWAQTVSAGQTWARCEEWG